jgi:hypothetical protein
MKNEADRLMEELEHIRSNAGTVGPDHPKVKKWVGDMRALLTRDGNAKRLKRFEQFGFVKGGSEMWSQYDEGQRNISAYKEELDKVAKILEETGELSQPSSESSADEILRELFFTPSEDDNQPEEREEKTDKTATQETPPLEKAMDQKIEPNFEVISKKHLAPSAREQAVDQLMAELNTEMKSAEPDWDKIQKTMADLMALKKTGELLDRLKAQVNTPDVTWETVREIMAELWSVRKEIIIDLLPTLLKSAMT